MDNIIILDNNNVYSAVMDRAKDLNGEEKAFPLSLRFFCFEAAKKIEVSACINN